MSLTLEPISVEIVHRLVPVALWRAPAGFPSPAADDLEDLVDPMDWIVRHESSTFFWRVSGDSLEVEGIFDGDIIAVDRAGKRRHGRVVLALVDGGITLKKLRKVSDLEWYLDPHSRNDQHKPIRCTETTEIWGVAAGIFRRLPIE